jgi:hypothetical protein
MRISPKMSFLKRSRKFQGDYGLDFKTAIDIWKKSGGAAWAGDPVWRFLHDFCSSRLARRASPFGGGGFQRLRLMPPTQGDADCSFSGSGFRIFKLSGLKTIENHQISWKITKIWKIMKNGGCGVPFEYHLKAICAGDSENSPRGCEVLGCSEYGGALQEPGVKSANRQNYWNVKIGKSESLEMWKSENLKIWKSENPKGLWGCSFSGSGFQIFRLSDFQIFKFPDFQILRLRNQFCPRLRGRKVGDWHGKNSSKP